MTYTSASYRVFTMINYLFMFLLALLCLLPIIHILAVSFSGKAAAEANMVSFWPIDLSFNGYRLTFANANFIHSIYNGILRTILGTFITIFLITLAAYALSKETREFKSRNIYAWVFVFTMMFNGGLVPTYIIVQKTGLMDTVWALVLPGAVRIFDMILLINFFRSSVPKALEEAAFIDGAGYLRTLYQIYIPIALPAIATVTLFTFVMNWNEWFLGLIYMSTPSHYPLASLLQTIIVQGDMSQMNLDASDLDILANQTLKAAQIFIAIVPVIVIYPFLQRYFVKGIVLGSVKE